MTETVNQLKHYLTIADITVLSQALHTLAILLRSYPHVTYPIVESQIVPIISGLVCSPLVSGAALSSTEEFFGTLVTVDNQIASHIIPNLITSLDRAGREGSPANVSKCIAQVVRNAMGIAAGTIAEFTKHVKVDVVLSLLHRSNDLFSAWNQVQRRAYCAQSTHSRRNRSFRVGAYLLAPCRF